mgnify:CR=1 FL=1
MPGQNDISFVLVGKRRKATARMRKTKKTGSKALLLTNKAISREIYDFFVNLDAKNVRNKGHREVCYYAHAN